MATSRSGKNKSSGLRILWIPGGRKSHPKGRYDSTNKHVSPQHQQRKNELWSLGGSRNQRDLLQAEPDTSLLDGPSVSGVAGSSQLAACTIGAVSASAAATAAQCATIPTDGAITETTPDGTALASTPQSANAADIHSAELTSDVITPTTPNSTTSTALLLPSNPQSPQPALNEMPAKNKHTLPVIVTTTTTAEIIEKNRFSLLAKDMPEEIDIYDFPLPPKGDSSSLLNTSSSTTASTGTTNTTTTTSTTAQRTSDEKQSKGEIVPHRRKSHHKYHNNNQEDINTIESIWDASKIPSTDLDWIDEFDSNQHNQQTLPKNEYKKKKKHGSKERDQLDGVSTSKTSTNDSSSSTVEDEKMVKCLYFTLMCCECSIS